MKTKANQHINPFSAQYVKQRAAQEADDDGDDASTNKEDIKTPERKKESVCPSSVQSETCVVQIAALPEAGIAISAGNTATDAQGGGKADTGSPTEFCMPDPPVGESLAKRDGPAAVSKPPVTEEPSLPISSNTLEDADATVSSKVPENPDTAAHDEEPANSDEPAAEVGTGPDMQIAGDVETSANDKQLADAEQVAELDNLGAQVEAGTDADSKQPADYEQVPESKMPANAELKAPTEAGQVPECIIVDEERDLDCEKKKEAMQKFISTHSYKTITAMSTKELDSCAIHLGLPSGGTKGELQEYLVTALYAGTRHIMDVTDVDDDVQILSGPPAKQDLPNVRQLDALCPYGGEGSQTSGLQASMVKVCMLVYSAPIFADVTIIGRYWGK